MEAPDKEENVKLDFIRQIVADDLKTGKRTEGSFYSIFWWFIKMGTALASFVAGALIVFTMFDETQVTKVDALQGSLRELRKEVQSWNEDAPATATYFELAEKARTKSAELLTHLEAKAAENKKYHMYQY